MVRYKLFLDIVDYLSLKYPQFFFSFEDSFEVDKTNLYIVYPKEHNPDTKRKHKKLIFDTWSFEERLKENVELIEYEVEHFDNKKINQYANELKKTKNKGMLKTNCVNCGAIIEKGKEKCSYCGTYY